MFIGVQASRPSFFITFDVFSLFALCSFLAASSPLWAISHGFLTASRWWIHTKAAGGDDVPGAGHGIRAACSKSGRLLRSLLNICLLNRRKDAATAAHHQHPGPAAPARPSARHRHARPARAARFHPAGNYQKTKKKKAVFYEIFHDFQRNFAFFAHLFTFY